MQIKRDCADRESTQSTKRVTINLVLSDMF